MERTKRKVNVRILCDHPPSIQCDVRPGGVEHIKDVSVSLSRWSLVTVRNEVAKVMFLQVSVCPRGGSLPQCMLGYHIPPGSKHPPRPQQTATAADGTHPTGMHSCLLLISILLQWLYTLLLTRCLVAR